MNDEAKKISVLVIDDEQLLTRIVSKHLESSGGFTVHVENSSVKAAATAREVIPDIILLDMVMPDLDGHAVSEALKAQEETKDIPILIISAMTNRSYSIGEIAEQDGSYFLPKPFLRNDLLRAIDLVLKNTK